MMAMRVALALVCCAALLAHAVAGPAAEETFNAEANAEKQAALEELAAEDQQMKALEREDAALAAAPANVPAAVQSATSDLDGQLRSTQEELDEMDLELPTSKPGSNFRFAAPNTDAKNGLEETSKTVTTTTTTTTNTIVTQPLPKATDAPAPAVKPLATQEPTKPVQTAAPTERPVDPKGYNTLQTIVRRFKQNIRLEQKASEVDFEADKQDCTTQIGKLNASIASFQESLVRASKIYNISSVRAEKVKAYIAKLEQLVTPKLTEVAAIDAQISRGEATRQQEARVYEKKRKDTRVVANAVQAIFDQLSDQKTTVFRFREQLLNAAASVSDSNVHSLLKSAVSAVAVLTNSPQDITNFKRLLGLLLSELNNYATVIEKTEAANRNLWQQSLSQLQSQQTLLNDAIASRRSQIRHKNERLRELQDAMAASLETRSSVPAKLLREQGLLSVWTNDCADKQTVFDQETVDRRLALSVLDSLKKLLAFKDYTTGRVLSVVTQNITVPDHLTTAAGSRCCKVCKIGTPCGNGCVPAGTVCKAAAGCACALSSMKQQSVQLQNPFVAAQNDPLLSAVPASL